MAGPRWVKLDVDYFDNPKVAGLGKDAVLLHLISMTYCGRYLTDGYLPAAAVEQVVRQRRLQPGTPARLEQAGLWMPSTNGPGWELHDFTAMNGTRAQVEARVEATRKRKDRWREQHRD